MPESLPRQALSEISFKYSYQPWKESFSQNPGDWEGQTLLFQKNLHTTEIRKGT